MTETNHHEAFLYATFHQEDNNLARCYLELKKMYDEREAMTIPNLSCPACGGGMSLKEPRLRSAVCQSCGYQRAVKKTALADGKTQVTFSKEPKMHVVQFRVTDRVYRMLGGQAANINAERFVLDSLLR